MIQWDEMSVSPSSEAGVLLASSDAPCDGFNSSRVRESAHGDEISRSVISSRTELQECSMDSLHRAVADLLDAVTSMFHERPEKAYGCVVRAAAMLRGEQSELPWCAKVPTVRQTTITPARGGLAPWVVKRVSTYIEAHLDRPITTEDLAHIAKQSVFHFGRAFRESFAEPPHRYVMRRRIERSQGLMLQTNLSLTQIAIDCGLSDQSHFNKCFRRLVGQSPGVWRRARISRLVD